MAAYLPGARNQRDELRPGLDARDLLDGRGAPLADAWCTGTSVRDFVRVMDERPFEEEAVRSVFGAPPEGAHLVFTTDDAEQAATAN
ncbi:hypothetical protein EAS64_28640 [Trebonia kvetii]|uniref:Uncharacterized protein n=1 Tax=Trebonia kvetii TaxID=2480626 RepID=A0A6P2BR27_9ACTN|nr:hypothetical protein [Trebonia kvetii]TVZ01482.1 hypothetical protein EAS64_28640 [Trebonia kvetii]